MITKINDYQEVEDKTAFKQFVKTINKLIKAGTELNRLVEVYRDSIIELSKIKAEFYEMKTTLEFIARQVTKPEEIQEEEKQIKIC